MKNKKEYNERLKEIEKYLDEAAVTIDSEVYVQVIIENQIEILRGILNAMLANSKGFYDENMVLKVSKALDELLNIYYRNKY